MIWCGKQGHVQHAHTAIFSEIVRDHSIQPSARARVVSRRVSVCVWFVDGVVDVVTMDALGARPCMLLVLLLAACRGATRDSWDTILNCSVTDEKVGAVVVSGCVSVCVCGGLVGWLAAASALQAVR